MFLEVIRKRNLNLIKFAKTAFSQGILPPNTYILDLDTIIKNVKKMKIEANKYNIKLYQMTKQLGRNPLVIKAIAKAGIKKVVCVDFEEALFFESHNIKIGNIGHLVQPPQHLIKRILKIKPTVLTVFGFEKAMQINQEAAKMKIEQDIILKVFDDKDTIYKGQKGGIHISQLKIEIKKIVKLQNLKIVGFTSFPTFLFNGKKIQKTHNIKTIKKAINIAKKMGLQISHINLPGANSAKTMSLISKHGGTHGEPGHALIGTIPSNAVKMMPEIPAIIYVSEVSHIINNEVYFYGGGYYRRSNFKNILLVNKDGEQKFSVNKFDPNAIDYYLSFLKNDHKVNVGDLVITSFRTQVFVTRAKVMVVKGIASNKPKILGVYSSQGEKIEWR